MGGEKGKREDSTTSLNTAFKRLKVDPDWNASHAIENADNICLKDLWKRDCTAAKVTPYVEERKNKIGGKSSAKTSSSRVEPYPQDFLCSMQKLSFHTEVCQSRSCQCSELTLKPRRKFNYACCSSSSRPLIREARLKVHHSEKDHKQVIRTAKLKLIKQSKHSLFKSATGRGFKSATSPPCPLPENINSLPVFGSSSSESITDFVSVQSKSDSDEEPEPTVSFGGHRVCGSVQTKRQWSLASDSSDSSEKERTKPQRTKHGFESCSQQARLDETSVEELACYFDDFVHIPKKMSSMAEMMYT